MSASWRTPPDTAIKRDIILFRVRSVSKDSRRHSVNPGGTSRIHLELFVLLPECTKTMLRGMSNDELTFLAVDKNWTVFFKH